MIILIERAADAEEKIDLRLTTSEKRRSMVIWIDAHHLSTPWLKRSIADIWLKEQLLYFPSREIALQCSRFDIQGERKFHLTKEARMTIDNRLNLFHFYLTIAQSSERAETCRINRSVINRMICNASLTERCCPGAKHRFDESVPSTVPFSYQCR